jgi:AraC family transcriptional regulator
MESSSVAMLATGRFYGTVVKSARVADANLSLVRHDRARSVPMHEHESAYFCVLIAGRYLENYGGSIIEYGPMTMALHPPRYRHADEIGQDGTVFFMIELADAWVEKLAGMIDLNAVKVELRGNDLVWLAMHIFREFTDPSGGSEMQIEALLYEMIGGAAHLAAISAIDDSWIGTAADFLERHATESLSVKLIATEAGVHPVTLARGFRVRYRQTVSDFVNRLRVRIACERIMNDRSASLASVSADCGFVDQSYFTKVFKCITGTTPAAFRDIVRGSINTEIS